MKSGFLAVMFTAFCFMNVPASAESEPELKLSAVSAVLMNADTGTIIGNKNPNEQRAIASITKIMTALLTIEAGNLDKQFVVDSYAIKVEGTSMGLRADDIVTRRALLYGMMLPSGNDAANAAAVSVSGTAEKFVALMNRRAAEIGMMNTHFANPHGLDQEGHYSTAYDMALLTKTAIANPLFKSVCSTKSISQEYGNPPYTRWLKNNNKLLNMYDGAFGVKTGFTDAARRCLVGAAERDGVTLITVTLSAADDWNDHIKMFDYGFSVVKRMPVTYDTSGLFVESAGCGEKIPVKLKDIIYLPLSTEEMSRVKIKPALKPFLYSGFASGDYAGMLEIYFDNKLYKTAPLYAAASCAGDTEKLGIFGQIKLFIERIF